MPFIFNNLFVKIIKLLCCKNAKKKSSFPPILGLSFINYAILVCSTRIMVVPVVVVMPFCCPTIYQFVEADD